jgi:BspA type Leucine rich repeat region (6 copies)
MLLNDTDSVTTIKNNAFYDSPYLRSISLGNGVTTIENGAFGGCDVLTSVNLPSSATNITHPFDYCNSLTAITVDPLNSAYSSAGGVLLSKSQTTVIEFPGGKFGSYDIPDGITSIADAAFIGCYLTSLTIPHGVTSIGSDAFAYSQGLTGVTIPNSVTNIGSYAFLDCSRLASISIPDSLATIGDYTFASCSLLTNITIPKTITSIGNAAFSGCGGLTGIYFKGNAPFTFSNTFQGDNAATVYYLPGTTGWGTTFGGRPALLWNPQARTTGGGFGVQQNQFGFNIAGTPDIPLVIETTSDLGTAWVTLQTCRLTNGSLYFGDPQWKDYSGRFYRIRSP